MRCRATLQAMAAGTALVLASCTDQTDPAAPSDRSPDPQLAALQGRTSDPIALGRAVPGFGGFFIDEQGIPTVYLKDPGQRGNAMRALEPFFRARGQAAARLQVRRGDYEWAELERWFAEASTGALGVAGAVYVDADEASNRVRIGVERGAGNRMRGALARLGVPAAAVLVEETEPVRLAAAPKPKPGGGSSLQGVVRPILGGVQINFPGFLCTLGFSVGGGSFITNSHCTNVQGGEEATPYWQPSQSASPSQIATEEDDPTYSGNLSGCPSGRICRFSDASRARYTSGFSDYEVGEIARTSKPGRSTSITGSFTITDEGAAVVGSVVNKVGRTTGWSQGRVTSTCAHTNLSGTNITQLCQNFVSATVGSGDSGSPVFIITGGTNVELVGILWGGSGSRSFVYSPMEGIERDLGGLTTF